MVPCVCYDYRAVRLSADSRGRMIKYFLCGDGYGSGRQGYETGLGKDFPVYYFDYGSYASAHEPGSHDDEYQADYQCGEGLELAVAEGVFPVLAFGRYAGEGEDDDVAEQVGDGMYAVGYHGCTSAEDAGCDLSCCEQKVDCCAP